MTFDEYQEFCKGTATIKNNRLFYFSLKLCGEAGEVAEKTGKILRDQHGHFTPEDRKAIAIELGDVLWYVAMLADEHGFKLSDVAAMNQRKLADRKTRGVLQGSGDNR